MSTNNLETQIYLDRYKARELQRPLMDAIIKQNKKRALAVWPRRFGKDFTALAVTIHCALKKVGLYLYLLPTATQARKIIWDGIDIDGRPILDIIPPSAIVSKHIQDMKIKLINGSIIQFSGSDNYDRLMGINAQGIVFSEYALQDPRAYQYLRPVLTAADGWALFISTPRGKNHLWSMYNVASHSDEWFCSKLSVVDTNHISIHDIQREIALGEMSEDLAQQEYYCSFELGVEGSYYAKYIDQLNLKSQIGYVPWEPAHPVYTAWDIGVHDSTAIIFFQMIGQTCRIIDCYEKNKEGLEHYVRMVFNKPYQYAKHFAPHDMKQMEFGSGMTRWSKAKDLGVTFTIVDNIPIVDGIEVVRSTLPKCWFNEETTRPLLKALENYRQEFDNKRKVYKGKPLHDQFSHFCFEGDTKISTENGPVSIKDCKEGMFIETPLGLRRILKVHSREVTELTEITIGKTKITTTPQHDIFTQCGLVKSDSLRYNDILEPNSMIRKYLWKKLFGYYCGENDLKGFKKTILSLKTRSKLCLMDTFIRGMEAITDHKKQRRANQACTDQYGFTTMVQYLKASMSTILMGIQKTMRLVILNVCRPLIILKNMPMIQTHGQNQIHANNCFGPIMQKQQNGTNLQRVKNGIEITHIDHFLLLEESSIPRNAKYVKECIQRSKHGKSSAQTGVSRNIGIYKDWMMKKGIALFVALYSFVINTVLGKHVVKNVRTYQLQEPSIVYDLTIEHDNCYYANGYLVSNSDAFRYLVVGLRYARKGTSAEELERRYYETVHGGQSHGKFFDNTIY